MIVVTGATGNVGRSLVTQLVARGHPVRALTRDPRRAALPAETDTVRADLSAPGALDGLVEGAEAVFLNIAAIGGGLGAGHEITARLLAAARRAGAGRAVMLSSGIIEEGADETHPIHVHHTAHENAVRDSGLTWTMLRPNAFSSNAFQWASQIRAGDTVRGPHGEAVTAPVHEADIAAVALRALLDDGHAGAVHRITGPEAVTTAEQIRIIGKAIGRELRFEEIPPSEVAPEMFPHVPPQMLATIVESFGRQVGVVPEITTTVEEVTGVPARPFTRWAEDHRADF